MVEVYIAREVSEDATSRCKGFAYATLEAPTEAIERFKEKYQGQCLPRTHPTTSHRSLPEGSHTLSILSMGAPFDCTFFQRFLRSAAEPTSRHGITGARWEGSLMRIEDAKPTYTDRLKVLQLPRMPCLLRSP